MLFTIQISSPSPGAVVCCTDNKAHLADCDLVILGYVNKICLILKSGAATPEHQCVADLYQICLMDLGYFVFVQPGGDFS